jgi:hypothetical protein
MSVMRASIATRQPCADDYCQRTAPWAVTRWRGPSASERGARPDRSSTRFLLRSMIARRPRTCGGNICDFLWTWAANTRLLAIGLVSRTITAVCEPPLRGVQEPRIPRVTDRVHHVL